jgi:hypothetical protein
MATSAWVVVDKIRCGRVGQEAELLEERVYFDDPMPDVGRPYRGRARKCSLGLDCNLAELPCRWSYLNPSYNPFTRG